MIAILTIALTMCVTTVSTCMEQELQTLTDKRTAQARREIAAYSYPFMSIDPICFYHYNANRQNIQETKSLLHTMTLTQQNELVMQKIYNEAYATLFDDTSITKINNLIENINTAKQKDLNEDILGKFSHNQHTFIPGRNELTTLFLSCLKQYNLSVATTEQAPSSINVLRQKFCNAPSTENYNTWLILYNDVITIKATSKSMNDATCSLLRNASAFIHDQAIKQHASLTLNNSSEIKTWKEQMCEYAFLLCTNISIEYRNFTCPQLITLVTATQQAMKNKYIKNELELGEFALNHTQSFLDAAFTVFVHDASYPNTKAKISLVFKFIQEYNAAYGAKITPTEEQMDCYKVTQQLHMALPNTFNMTLLNPDHVAFAGYEELQNNIATLQKAKTQEIEECVHEFYPTYKID